MDRAFSSGKRAFEDAGPAAAAPASKASKTAGGVPAAMLLQWGPCNSVAAPTVKQAC
jgi:hypothetical protein